MQFLGSLAIAVPLLIIIAVVLAWGTIYEATHGTAAVQRFVYHAWWFQALLGFLAVNLAIAALERYPWKRRHLPFVLAHLGIILILIGGILGGVFGIEGQLIIPEGQAEHTLETPGNVLVVHLPTAPDPIQMSAAQAGQPNPGLQHIIATQFETQAWVHEPNVTIPMVFGGRTIQLTVDRFYPDAVTDDEITEGGSEENPAVRVALQDREQQETLWLFARDPERFGTGWGDAHVLFLEPKTDAQLAQLTGRIRTPGSSRGVVSLKLRGMKQSSDIPVPETLNQPIAIKGTRYRITFKDYFSDFAITEQGPTSRSDQPNNPAVSFLLDGPEGADAYLLFALHPEFQAMHGLKHAIPAEVTYVHAASAQLPPNAIAVLRGSDGALSAVLTGSGMERTIIDPVVLDASYTHPSLGYQFRVIAHYPRAVITQHVRNRGNEVKAEAVHLVAKEGAQSAEGWVMLRGTTELNVGAEPILVEYRPSRRELPVTIKLLNFRKTDYPGTQMAAAFESDVEASDTQRGVILMRKITMNHPLRYRGFSFYQSSYIDGPTKTTVLSVRSDPGTPFVYAGFIIVILGVVTMFIFRDIPPTPSKRPRTRRARTKSAT